MHQHKRERLPHLAHPTHTSRPKPSHLGTILFLLTSTSALAQTPAPPPQLNVRILNAQTNKPVSNERLNVSFHADQPGGGTLPTDKFGLVHLHPAPDATTVRILSNFYADCRPRSELYTNYLLTTLRSTGISTANLCSSAHPSPKPGELLLFVIPRTQLPTYGQPPASRLPHSDENPHTTTDYPVTPPPIPEPTPPSPPRP